MRNYYQDIFWKQDILEGPSSIENFLNSQGDSRPLLELNRRKLTNDQRNSLEGQITLDELTRSLFEDMKGSLAPRIDGYTVNFIPEFWPPLGHLVKDAVNESKSKGELTSTMRFAIFKLLQKGPHISCKFQTNKPIISHLHY